MNNYEQTGKNNQLSQPVFVWYQFKYGHIKYPGCAVQVVKCLQVGCYHKNLVQRPAVPSIYIMDT